MKKVVVLISGGIDSSVAVAYLKSKNCEIHPLFINHHQGPVEAERKAANSIASSLGVPAPIEIEVDLKSLKDLNCRWLNMGIGTPARNMVFISIATMFAGVIGADGIALASAYGSTYPDTSHAFLSSITRTGSIVLDRSIRIFSPFKAEKWTSSEIVRQGAKLGVPLEKTWSCFLPREVQCGVCVKCKDRIERFQKAGLDDPTPAYSDDGVTREQLNCAMAFV